MFTYLKTLFGYISLRNFAVSNARKLRFALEVLLLAGLIYYEQFIAEFVLAPRLIQVLTVLLVSHLVANLLRFFLTTAYRRSHKIKMGERDNFLIGLDALVLLFTILVTLGSVFPIYNIPFREFLTGLSLFAVAIVWGFQPYITNFFDGLRLMFSSDFRIGDYVRIDDKAKGIITHVSFRATRLRTDDGDIVFVPNTTLLNTEVTNFSKLKYKRIVVPFIIAHCDAERMTEFEQYLRTSITEQFSKVITLEKTYLRIVEIKKEEIVCSFEVTTDHYSFDIEDQITKKVNQAVLTWA